MTCMCWSRSDTCNNERLSEFNVAHIISTSFVPTNCTYNYKKVKWSRYRPGVAQMVGRGIALLFHDRDTRRGWVVSSTLRPHFTPGKEMVRILREAGWAAGPVWTGGKSRPHRDSIPDCPALVSRYTDWTTGSTYIIIHNYFYFVIFLLHVSTYEVHLQGQYYQEYFLNSNCESS